MNKRCRETAVRGGLTLLALTALAVLAGIVFYLFKEGLPVFKFIGPLRFIFGTDWYPVGDAPDFEIGSLIAGSLAVTVLASVIAVPLGIATAAYLSEVASANVRRVVKPFIELLAALPSVVIGFIGMTAGGILIGAWGGFKNRMKTLTVGLIAFGTLAIGMGAVDSFAVYLLLMAVYGVALTMVQTASTTLLQKQSSPQMQGRVFGLFGAMYSGFLPLGMAVFGPLADVVSLRLLMILSGLLLLAMAAIILLNRKFYFHSAKNAE